ncbi:hypothetical protein [Paludisphaera borealis]|uniref:Transmembrane protein n=1 Tax=Paludisphaera borealis TaxID=1387353 RepID=A0A1U7CQF1_9BACT|nr:hypothetical protein [Paludisphaera borealis]APW61151.1 hypothetical protein BSF38_02655 [Paludisphaera borealis]
MGDQVKKPQANAKAWTPPSEFKIWFGALAMVGVNVVFFSIWDHCAGKDLGSLVSGRVAAALGFLLGWGVVHAVSRRHEDIWWFTGLGGLLGEGVGQRSLLTNFTLSLAGALVVCSLCAVTGRSLRRALDYQSPKASPPQSGHLLYDADVDGAT